MIQLVRDRRKILKALPLALMGLVSLTGCDVAIDCIDDDGPELSPRSIPDPILNQAYDERITAFVENEPFDNRFGYDIIISNTLPPGLTAFVFERQVRITGATTELGSFTFDISVAVFDPNFNNGFSNAYNNSFNNGFNNFSNTRNLCRVTNQRTYQLTVRQSS